MITKREGESFGADRMYSRCLIIKELTGATSKEHSRDVFERIMSDILIPAIDRFNPEMFAYAIRGNTLYLIITTMFDEGRVTRIIEYIKSRFAERYHQAMNRSGSFWIDRSACEIID